MGRLISKLENIEMNPPRVLLLGFGGLIFLGAILLNLPIASQNGESIGFINAMFTAASSVCVTGLVVVNTAYHWTLFGQVVIILLIQAGGLGFMTLATIMALLIGKKITLKERLVIKEQLNQETMSGLVRLTKYVVLATFSIEGIGALLFSTRFIPMYGLVKGIWYSVFHAISAFCNAGFDISGDSIVPFVGDYVINLTICGLIIVGGLGFTVYLDIGKHKKFRKFSLHTKLVLTITSALLILGTLIFYMLESDNQLTLGDLNLNQRILASFFQATVPRTAGFYSVNMAALRDSSIFLMIILMFIGGSPCSTGGGIKTTTFGSLVLATLSVIKGNKDVVAFKKRISYDVINKSIAIIMIGLIWVVSVSFILTITEDADFLDLLFETTSAFATVGLTTGVTPELSDVGKLILTFTMYAGRVGPLTMAFAFSKHHKPVSYKYSEGNIMVG
ncbi:TrkH family potassium uptake protein [Tissierella sp. Yu-01]|uniref:TrkH family potassium uptake protein n=1 Tax=Tissierella sp. Yu-01 TaxID=3035694 RepID=UPI00240D6E26|nr:TrkH family potassium uptake protein [Tissierella sp. Yu-01]WFA09882.1 TrkH family potassium uptake protein [Tissierella sp. Yu-01]